MWYITVNSSCHTVLWTTGTYYFYMTVLWYPLLKLPLSPIPSPFPASSNHYFEFRLTFCISHVRQNMRHLSFYVWLISLNTVTCCSIHFAANVSVSVIFYDLIICHCVYVPHFLRSFSHSWIPRLIPHHGHCNGAALNTGYSVSLKCLFHFPWIYTQKRGSWVIS